MAATTPTLRGRAAVSWRERGARGEQRPPVEAFARAGLSASMAGRAAAVLLVTSGALSLASLVRPNAPGEDPVGVLIVGCAATLLGLLVWFLPWSDWPRAATLMLLVPGFALVAARNVVGGDDPYLYAIFYIVLFIWLGLAHPPGTAFKALPLLFIAYVTPLWLARNFDLGALGSVIYIMFLSLIVGEVLSYVSTRWRESQSALLGLHGAMDALGDDLARGHDSGKLWQAGLEELCRLIDVPNGDMYRLDDAGRLECLASVAEGRPYPEYIGVRGELSLWEVDGEAIAGRRPVLISSPGDERLSEEERSEMLSWGERAMLVVPLFARHGVVGIVELGETREGRTITPEQAAAAESVCRLLAFSVYDAELLAEQASANKKLATLYDVSRAVAASPATKDALAIIAREGAAALGFDECIAYEYDVDADALVARARWARTPSAWDRIDEPIPLDEHTVERRLLESGEPLLERVSDPALDATSRAVLERWGHTTCLTVPMGSSEGAMGLLTFWQGGEEHALSETQLALARSLADLAGEAVRSGKLLRRLTLLSETDALTGLANHRKLREALEREDARARRYGTAFAVVMIDVDGFKLLNDTYGHPTGDSVLAKVGHLLDAHTRGTDVVGRYGGDEFILVLPESTAAEAAVLAEKLLQVVHDEPYVTAGGEKIPLHLSIGIAGCPEDHEDVNELVAAADANLYASKRRGGDTITSCLAEESRDGGGTFTMCDSLVTAVDNKDAYTRRHSEEVTEYALVLGAALGLPDETLGVLRVAGLLHDIGKIGVPDRILRKPGRLAEGEYEIVKRHSELGGMIIAALPNLEEIRGAVVSHHERFDGRGYPHRLAGVEIPLLGRILAVADAYSAMTTDRPYRQALSHDQAVAELRGGAGAQFDPELVELFVAQVERARGAV